MPKAMPKAMGRTPDYYNLKVSYKRNSDEGGIGFISQPGGPGEPQLSKWQPLKYVEWLKTLKSFILEKALPNKAVKWLPFKSLALLAMPRKSGDEAVKFESEIKIEEEHSDHILELQGPQLHVQWQARTWGSCVFGAGG